MTGIKDNGIKHCCMADKSNTLLEPSLKVLFIKIWMGSLGDQHSVAVMCPPRDRQDVGSSPAATMNEKTDIGRIPASEGGPMVQQDLIGRPVM